MKLGTFTKSDYLAVGPYAWARAKTPREAYKMMLTNLPSFVKRTDPGNTATIWRLTDATDTVRVDDTGNFNVDSGELPFHCGSYVVGMPVKYVPENFPVPSPYKEGN